MHPEIAEIESRRERVPVSKYDLAVRAGLNHTTYIKLSNGVSKRPHPRTINKLRRALETLERENAA